jgi:hypothetical protein
MPSPKTTSPSITYPKGNPPPIKAPPIEKVPVPSRRGTAPATWVCGRGPAGYQRARAVEARTAMGSPKTQPRHHATPDLGGSGVAARLGGGEGRFAWRDPARGPPSRLFLPPITVGLMPRGARQVLEPPVRHGAPEHPEAVCAEGAGGADPLLALWAADPPGVEVGFGPPAERRALPRARRVQSGDGHAFEAAARRAAAGGAAEESAVVIRCVCAADGCSNTFVPKRRGRPRLYCAACSTGAAYNRRWRAGERHAPPPTPYVRLLPGRLSANGAASRT